MLTQAIDQLVLVYFKDGFENMTDINQSSSIISLVLQIMKHLDIQDQIIER